MGRKRTENYINAVGDRYGLTTRERVKLYSLFNIYSESKQRFSIDALAEQITAERDES